MVRLPGKLSVMLLTLVLAVAPIGVRAQTGPSDDGSAARETIHGKISSFDSATGNMQLDDDRGFIDNVQLEQNTVVEPRDAELSPGTVVTIVGAAQGSVFAADRVDVGHSAVAAAPPEPAGPPPGLPQGAPPPGGTIVTGTIGTALDSKNAYVGEPVSLHDVLSQDGAVAHATLLGTVTDVIPAGQGRNAQVRMHFDHLRFNDGSVTPVDGAVVSVDVHTKNNALKEVGGALAGMIAGNALGTIVGLAGGGLLGAVGGFLIAHNNRENVVIPQDSTVTVQLLNPRRRQAG